MTIHPFPVGAIQANCYLAADERSARAVCIDPGAEPGLLLAEARGLGLTVAAVFLTHGHYDHVAALEEVARAWVCPAYLHHGDRRLYLEQERLIAEYAGGRVLRSIADYPGRTVDVAPGFSFNVHHTPGHSAGGVCIEFADGRVLFTGDTLFRGTVGRSDLPGSDEAELARSLKTISERFKGYTVFPGHGPSTTVDDEIRRKTFEMLD